MGLLQKIKRFQKLEQDILVLNHAIALLYYDSLTSCNGYSKIKSEHITQLETARYELLSGEKTLDLFNDLLQYKYDLPEELHYKIIFLIDKFKFERSIPKKNFKEYTQKIRDSELAWVNSKKNNDIRTMKQKYFDIIKLQKEFARNYDSSKDAYDVLLDHYETQLSQKEFDTICSLVKKKLIPIIFKIKEKNKCNSTFYMPKTKQELLMREIISLLKLPDNVCSIAEAAHPFTIKLCRGDIKVTTHYSEQDFSSSLFSILHEGGHALYEYHMDEFFNGSCLCGGMSMDMHEGQALFFENQIGRSKAFLSFLFKQIKKIDAYWLQTDFDNFYKNINLCNFSPLRIEADELTYPIHIIIRYEIEKALFHDLSVLEDIENIWKEKYKNYLGINITTNTEGILQDPHWSSGNFAYFPSYFIGSCYAALFMNAIKAEIDIFERLERGDLYDIIEWLKINIYQKWPGESPRELIKKVCKKDFSADHYLTYLVEKYKKIYHLD